ncbi:hypothetical protein C4577_03785 [Candidatus Parcubacteria bacterium]|nr:MAG: hypothetical protein C4577_03785 [Candidatus Parcubacteria bacterium]
MQKISYFLPFFVALFIFITLSWSLFSKQGFPEGHDIYAHTTYGKLFYQALEEGQFPVRWTEWVKEGHSQPLFNFYQVGFYYFLSTIHFIIPSFILSIKISLFILWLTGSLFTYLFMKKFGTLPATIAVLVYSFSPYLFLDIYIRSAFPEFMVITLMPGLFWSLDRLLTRGRLVYLPFLSFFTGFAIISHLPAFIIFTPLIVGYILLLFLKKETGLWKIVQAGAGGLLGIGLASFYLLPAIFELNLINIELLKSTYFDFHQHFVDINSLIAYFWGYAGPWKQSENKISYIIISAQWTLLTMSSLTLISSKKLTYLKPYLFFSIIGLIYILFFSQKLSTVVWEKLFFLQFIQFPWRFFMVIPFISALLSGVLLSTVSNMRRRIIIILFLIITILIIYPLYLIPAKTISLDFFDLSYRQWKNHPLTQKEAYIEPGYNPKGVIVQPENLNKKWQSEANVILQEATSHSLLLQIFSLNNTTIVIHTYYFPGWRAWIGNQEVPITPTKNNNFIKINLPKGSYDLQIKFTDTPIRGFSNLVSLVSIFILSLLLVTTLHRNLVKKLF